MLLAAIACLPVQERVHSLTGNIRHLDGFESRVLGNRRNVIIYLPPDYATAPTRRYPVLYMNDGQNVMDGMTSFIPNKEWQIDETAERLIRSGVIEPVIIVGIDNAGMARADEYLPDRVKLGERGPEAGGRADLYGKMLTTELMPYINRTFRTETGPANTAIAGSSLGAVVSMHLGLSRPDVFGKLGLVSPSLWWNHRAMLDRAFRLPTAPRQLIWLDIGTKEGDDAVQDARDLESALLRLGWTLGTNLMYMEADGAEHNESAWAARMEPMLRFFYGTKK